MTDLDLDLDALGEGLDRAMDALLAVRVALGDPSVAVPGEALDEALRRDEGYQDAQRGFGGALERLLHAAGDELRDSVLDVEAIANAVAARAAEAAWLLGVRVRGGAGDQPSAGVLQQRRPKS